MTTLHPLRLAAALALAAGILSAQTSATFVQTDTTTQGNWKGVYGADGGAIYSDPLAYPSYAQINFAGQGNSVWTPSTTDVRALQKSTASDRIAPVWYTWSNFTIDINFTDGRAHKVALYCLDWDTTARAQTVDVLDASTSAVLDSRPMSSFQNGLYLVWYLQGHVTLRVTLTGGVNAVASGLFFSNGPAQPGATFVKTDAATQGNWKGVYGAEGESIYSDSTSYPAYAQVAFNGPGYSVWASSTSDVRALQKSAASGRIAPVWYTFSSFTIDINLTDGQPHQVSLYCLDWDTISRAERIDILDATTNAVLDTRTISSFQNGLYLVWTLQGHVTIRVTLTGGANAVASGLFFDEPTAPVQLSATPVSVTASGWTGHLQTFTFTWSDPANQSNISSFQVKFGPDSSATANTCWLSFDRSNIYFHDDNGNNDPSLTVPFTAASALQNHQCGVMPWLSGISGSGNNLTLTLSMYFVYTRLGPQSIYMKAYNGVDSGWSASKGTYTATDNTPSVNSVSVATRADGNPTFTFNYSDPDTNPDIDGLGTADFSNVQVQFNNTGEVYNHCFLVIDRRGWIYLSDDADVNPGAPQSVPAGPGSSYVQNTSHCGVDGSLSQLGKTNTTWALSLAMKFLSGDPPPRLISAMAIDQANMSSGWPSLGSWPPPVPDYQLTLTPVQSTVVVGGYATYNLTVTPSTGFTGTVTISATTAAGSTLAISPSQLTIAGTSAVTVPITITPPANTVAATTNLNVAATSGTLTRTASAPIRIETFSPNISPSTLEFKAGTTATFHLDYTASSNFDQTVSYTRDGNWPPQVAIVATGDPTLLSITSSNVWFYANVPIWASAGGVMKQQLVNINVTSANPTLVVSPPSVSLYAGQFISFGTNVNVTWSISPQTGQLSSTALTSTVYTAPSSIAQRMIVILTAQPSTGAPISAMINLLPAGTTAVTISAAPPPITVGPGGTQQFAATVTGIQNTDVSWSVASGLGDVSSRGLYTAPCYAEQSRRVTIRATAFDGTSGTLDFALSQDSCDSFCIATPLDRVSDRLIQPYLSPGNTIDLPITISSTSGFNAPVGLTFNVIGNPNITVTANPASVTPSPTAPVITFATISVPAGIAAGPYTLTITGTATNPNVTHTLNLPVTVTSSSNGLVPHTLAEINMGFLYFASKSEYWGHAGTWYTNTQDVRGVDPPFNAQDPKYPVLDANCTQHSDGTSDGHKFVRECIQEILAKYKAQGITGVRFQFSLHDALQITPGNETAAQVRPAWINEVTAFFQDLYNAGIYNITPTVEMEGALSPKSPDFANTLYPPPPNTGQTYSVWYDGGAEIHDGDRYFLQEFDQSPYDPTGSCADYGKWLDPNTQTYVFRPVRFRFNPVAPYGERCLATSSGTACDINGPKWDFDRGTIDGQTGINDAYTCSPQNPAFVGWTKIYDVIGALLSASNRPFGTNDARRLTVEELDMHNEIDLEYLPIRARLIVDNTNGNWDVLGQFGSSTDSLRRRMSDNGYDPARVTYSALDAMIFHSYSNVPPDYAVPAKPGASLPNPQVSSDIATFDCFSYYGDSAREHGASQLIAALTQGYFGIYSVNYNHPGAQETNGLPCLVAPGENLSPINVLARKAGITFQLKQLPVTHQLPSILDVHTAPCINVPIPVLDANGNATREAVFDCDPNPANQGEVAQTATVQFNALQSLLASFGSGGNHCCDNPNFANALMILGETYGQVQTACKSFTGAGWDRQFATAANIVSGFNVSNMACPVGGSCHAGTTVFRPWEYLVNQPARLGNGQINFLAPDPVRCSPVVVNPPFTPNK